MVGCTLATGLNVLLFGEKEWLACSFVWPVVDLGVDTGAATEDLTEKVKCNCSLV